MRITKGFRILLGLSRSRRHIGISIVMGGSQKWMVYQGNPMKMDDLGVITPIYIHIWKPTYEKITPKESFTLGRHISTQSLWRNCFSQLAREGWNYPVWRKRFEAPDILQDSIILFVVCMCKFPPAHFQWLKTCAVETTSPSSSSSPSSPSSSSTKRQWKMWKLWLVGGLNPSEKYERQLGWLATQYMEK